MLSLVCLCFKPGDEIRKTLHEKVGNLDAIILLPRVQENDYLSENMFSNEGDRSHFDHLTPLLRQLAADEPMASVHLRQWTRDGLGDAESWGWNLVFHDKGPLCLCIVV